MDNRRNNKRQMVPVDLSSHIQSKSGDAVSCIAIDVSTEGLGIIAFQNHAQGDILLLKHRQETIELKVMWSKSNKAINALYHLGLQTDQEGINLIEIINTVSQSSSQVSFISAS